MQEPLQLQYASSYSIVGSEFFEHPICKVNCRWTHLLEATLLDGTLVHIPPSDDGSNRWHPTAPLCRSTTNKCHPWNLRLRGSCAMQWTRSCLISSHYRQSEEPSWLPCPKSWWCLLDCPLPRSHQSYWSWERWCGNLTRPCGCVHQSSPAHQCWSRQYSTSRSCLPEQCPECCYDSSLRGSDNSRLSDQEHQEPCRQTIQGFSPSSWISMESCPKECWGQCSLSWMDLSCIWVFRSKGTFFLLSQCSCPFLRWMMLLRWTLRSVVSLCTVPSIFSVYSSRFFPHMSQESSGLGQVRKVSCDLSGRMQSPSVE